MEEEEVEEEEEEEIRRVCCGCGMSEEAGEPCACVRKMDRGRTGQMAWEVGTLEAKWPGQKERRESKLGRESRRGGGGV